MIVSIYKYKIAFNRLSEMCHDEHIPFPNDNELENNCRKEVMKCVSGTFELSSRLDEKGIFEKVINVIKL